MKQRPTEKHGSPRRVCRGRGGHRGHKPGHANPYQNLLGRLSARDQHLLDRLPLVPPASFHGPCGSCGCGLWHGSPVIGSACSHFPHLARVVIHGDKLSLLDEIAYTISFGICGEASPRVFVTCQSVLVFACRCLRAESFKDEGEASE
jgi:hypothetical protein